MEIPAPHPGGRLGAALARLATADGLGPDPLIALAAEHGAFIAFAIDPRGTLVRSVGPPRDAIREARGETVRQNVFEVYADLPAVTGAVARALRGVPVQARLEVDGMVLDCYFVPVHSADGEFLGVRGVALRQDTMPTTPAEAGLSRRESEVTQRLARGLTNVEIGDELFIAPTTVANYVRAARIKLGVASRGELHTYAVERGWNHLGDPDG